MSPTTPIRIIIADDHELMRAGLIAFFEKETDIIVIGEASNGQQLVDKAVDLKPDIVLTSLKMAIMDGVTATRMIRMQSPFISVIALSLFDSGSTVTDVIKAGARGYVTHSIGKETITQAIRTVYRGETYYYCTPAGPAMNALQEQHKGSVDDRSENLDERELEMIRMFCNEKTCHEVGEAMYMSVRTVEGYRRKIFQRLGVKNLAGMVLYAIKTGIYKIN
jgi:two-component system, NarL family, response regulator NreC